AVTGDKALESTFSKVPSAQRADSASFAESANPEAFAYVSKEASFDSNLSKNIAFVKDGNLAGIYCIAVQGFHPRGAQVTHLFEVSGAVTAYVIVGGTSSCPAPQVEVQTFDGGVRAREAFYLVVYR